MKFVYNHETKETNVVSTLDEVNSIQKILRTIDCEEGRCSSCPLDSSNGCCLYLFEEFLTDKKNKLLRKKG